MINQKTIKDTTIEGFENAIEDTLKKRYISSTL